MPSPKNNAILLLVSPDQPGLVSAISDFVFQHRGNIVDSDQHTDFETGTFLMRLEWEMDGFALDRPTLAAKLKPLAEKFQLQHSLHFTDRRCRMAVLVSKYQHCLYDLLVRHTLRELDVEIPLILSNHPDLQEVAEHFNIPFHHVAVTPQNKKEAEARQLALLKEQRVDLLVLARYMQILSSDFVAAYPNAMINIHHSFLPAFIGGKPYHQAYARGVKLIGATSHYVTAQLDEGPIIAQSVTHVSHKDRVEDLVRKGRDQEKLALAYAVRMHAERRILTYNNKTVVFE
ncbi:MAG TPA: formyltetrahydrofolate deformylase [Deltaproteobacteria bacterium]|nr:formyltetrahydrofolate deformylase [Deltaproteobacteria bacterium]